MGKVESGTLRMDDEVAIAPTKKKAKVDAIYVGEDKVRSAKVHGLTHSIISSPYDNAYCNLDNPISIQ